MSDLHKLIARLRKAGVHVKTAGEQLSVKAPKGALTPELAAELRSQKEALLAFLRDAQNMQEQHAFHIRPAEPEQRDRLSDAQERLWFLYQLEGATPAYNMPLGIQISGDLDIDRLEHALTMIAERHETLRTRFIASSEGVRTVIDPKPALTLELRPADSGAQSVEQQITKASDAAVAACFLLSDEHAIKTALQPLSDGSHLLLVTLHHIIADGWSISNLIHELSQLYAEPETTLAPLEIQYADYVAWSRARRDTTQQHLDWWRNYLHDAPTQAPLPFDQPRPVSATYRGAEQLVTIDHKLVSAVEQLARATDSTAYMVYLAGFALFLQRIAGSAQTEDWVIGTTIANRDVPQLEPLIGLFINMLPLRLSPASANNVTDLIHSIKEQYLSAHKHRGVAFERIVEAVNPPRTLNHAPIFQIAFDLQNQPDANLTLGNCELRPIAPRVQHAKFDLSVTIELTGDHAQIRWIWNTDVLHSETIAHWAQAFLALMRNLVRDPAQSLSAVSSEVPETRHAWIARQLQCKRDLPESCWLDAFDQHALQKPDQTAVIAGNQTLSYAELRQRARTLAQNILAQGVGKDDRVAVLQDRHGDLLASLLAVQYAGATYVPLDPGFPEERLRWVLEDAQPTLVLTEQRYTSLDVLHAMPCLAVEKADDSIAITDLPGPTFTSLAYIIFTSGSTGRPKGVQIEHRALVNFLRSMAREPGLSQNDTLLAVTTLSFDIAALELFLPLMVGARIVLADRMTAVDGRALRSLLDQHKVTCLQATPSTWRLLLDAGWRKTEGLKALCGGEALPNPLGKEITATGAELWNMYGPTETTIWSATRRIEQTPSSSSSGIVPIGSGIDNNYLYVLNENNELAGPGGVGELWIGGLGLARGYWQRAELTAERYRPDPFSGTPGARMYGTGDLVRVRTDGNLDFLNRIDHQVKLRGFRIELGEIESVLLEHETVSAAVALIVGDDLRTQQLVVFVQTNHRKFDFKAYLRQKLPTYMVPSIIETVATLPLTPNGKIDRRALAAWVHREPAPQEPTLAHGKLQEQIARIWSEALHISSPDIDTNIFDLGAHSLMLAQVQTQLEKTLGKTIELVALFRYPTIRGLAEHLERAPRDITHRLEKNKEIKHGSEIAVIGMSAILPGAKNVEDFWALLESGADGIRHFSLEELRAAGLDETLITSPNFVPVQGAIDGIEQFDAEFFGYSPAQAKLIDPQHRMFLQTAVHALEDAGYAAFDKPQNIGVYGGCGQNDYLVEKVLPYLNHGHEHEAYNAMVASEKDYLTTRVSYLLNLTGPSLDIQTACSSGLVALHVACRALRAQECEMALAGAISLRIPQANGHLYQDGMIVSNDGCCRAFDADASGTVWGSGVIAFVLKPLAHAQRDGDTVHAVIKGSAINNDGAGKVGFTAPGIDGQTALLNAALRDAGVTPGEIGMIEAHGTATALGDMIEVSALKEVWGESNESCALGSVKSQIGHLNSASGLAGLLKTVLSLKKGIIPPTRGFKHANPKIGLEHSPFRVLTTAEPWPSKRESRIAGVSSFGIGGTNAHVIVAAANETSRKAVSTSRPQILALSTKHPDVLEPLCQSAAQLWQEQADELRNTAWTLIHGRSAYTHRAAVIAGNLRDAAIQIQSPGIAPIQGNHTHNQQHSVAFLFPGQGTQSAGMARGLYQRFKVFRDALEACADILNPKLGINLATLVCDDYGGPTQLEHAAQIHETWLAQPVLFTLEYALAKLWMSFGVRPTAVMGHSLGEITAACISGVFDLSTALELVYQRGQIAWRQPSGSMLAVGMQREELLDRLPEDLDLAAANAPMSQVVAGEEAAMDRFERELREAGIPCTRLHVSHAFHSRIMSAGIAPLADYLATQTLSPPQLPLVSNFTGEWITDDQATDPDYWANQFSAPVLFAQGASLLASQPNHVLLEVGPGNVLSGLLRNIVTDPTRIVTGTSEEQSILEAAAMLWCQQVDIDLSQTLGDDVETTPQRAALPPYPFRPERHWIDTQEHASAGRRLGMDRWFSMAFWQPAPLSIEQKSAIQWQLVGELPEIPGASIHPLEGVTALNLQHLAKNPEKSGLLLSLSATDTSHPCLALTRLLKNWVTNYPGTPLRVRVLTPPLHAVGIEESPNTEYAPLRGLILAAAQEHPSLNLRCIEMDASSLQQFSNMANELASDHEPQFVAYRRGQRFIPKTSAITLPEINAIPALLHADDCYLITGGTGRMGIALARHLIQRVNATVLLVSRHPPNTLPLDLQEQAQVFQADVSDPKQVANLFAQIKKKGLYVNGLFHAAGDPNHVHSFEDAPEQWPWPAVATKLDGARHLAQHLGEQTRFAVLMSSLASQIGGLGYAEYSAANAGLDALAIELSQNSNTQWVSIGWDAWRFNDQQPKNWINPEEGTQALERILHAMPLRHVLVSTSDLQNRAAYFLPPPDQEVTTEHKLALPNDPSLTPTQSVITAVWQSMLGHPKIGLDDDYFALGGDSLLAIRVIETLRTHLQRPIGIASIVQHPTIRSLAQAIESDSEVNTSIRVRMNSSESARRIVILPGTGGSIMYLTALARELGKLGYRCEGLQAVGLNAEQPPRETIEEIAQDNLAALDDEASQYVAFVGHSLGSWVGLEMSRQLAANGQTSPTLIALDAAAPAERLNDALKDWTDADWILSVASNVIQSTGADFSTEQNALKGLSWRQMIAWLHDKMIGLNLLPPGSSEQLVEGIVEIFRRQSQISYSPDCANTAPIKLIRARHPLEEFLLGIPEAIAQDPTWGWAAFSTTPVSIEETDGNHLTMVAPEQAHNLAQRIDRVLKSNQDPHE